ncbi:wax ester/triacylglycerol synthase domain-containing protein [Georgenia sp. M64]|uniref:wax ester/triacylglycerol synthase domain-containing protein n=1 Tax=Georgenia sp. M64 TaxID=3120520 RepID=UPI0030E14F02
MTLERRPARPDRLSAMDVTNLMVEARGVVMHVAALAVLDGRPLRDPAGEVRLDAVREYVSARLPRRLRQRLVLPPRGMARGAAHGGPRWSAPGAIDLTRHVRTRALDPPADEAALLETCTRINERPLDRRYPLWEMWLLTGLPENRVGLFLRLHHVIADGVAVLGLLESLFEGAPGAPPHGQVTDPGAGRGDATVRDAAERAPTRQGLRATTRAVATGARLTAARAVETAGVLRAGRAPAVSFNRPVGGRSRVVLARADLARTKAVAHAHGGKVNDVVLAAVAGGARRLLEQRGELSDDLVLRVSVIASLRDPAAARSDGAPGNLTGVRVVPVPVGEADPVRRLKRIAAHTAARRGRPPLRPGGRLLRRWMVGVMNHQRMVNLLVSNLPGPTAPLVFAGAPVLELFQLGTNQGNLALSVGVLSYAGTLEIDVVGDGDVVPDLDAFVSGLTDTLVQLGAC